MVEKIWLQFVGLLWTFELSDLLDILMVSYIIYKVIQLIRDTRAAQLFKGLAILLLVYGVVKLFNLRMMDYFLINLFQVGVFALIVLFQPELRKALEQLGRSKMPNLGILGSKTSEELSTQVQSCIKPVVEGCMILRNMKMGALIVFERTTKLGEIINTGTVVNAQPTPELIGNIFFNKAPLHDGAMIIRDGKVYAAGCILPLTQNANVSSELGTRHRAALGMSEASDAIIVIVSEETGNMSVAQNGRLTRNYTKDTLQATLANALLPEEKEREKKAGLSSLKNSRKKVEKNGK